MAQYNDHRRPISPSAGEVRCQFLTLMSMVPMSKDWPTPWYVYLGPTLRGPSLLSDTGVRCLRFVTGVDVRELVGTTLKVTTKSSYLDYHFQCNLFHLLILLRECLQMFVLRTIAPKQSIIQRCLPFLVKSTIFANSLDTSYFQL